MSDTNIRKQSTTEDKQKRVTLATPLGKEELVVSTPNQRNWRGILIALLVIVAVLGLIVCSIVLLSPPDEGPRVKGLHFTLDNIIGSQFEPVLFNGSWVSNTSLVYMDQHGGVAQLCLNDNVTVRVLMTNLTFRQVNAVDYRVSADLNYVLLLTDVVPVWEHSYKARYYVYDVDSQEHFPLEWAEEDDVVETLPYLEAMTWSPTGHSLAYIYKGNLYYKQKVRRPQVYAVTRDGVEGVVFHGRPDYMYETKVLHEGTALWFSEDSSMLVYATFNCSQVGQVHYPYYTTSIYEDMNSIRCPRPGTDNPQVFLTVVDLRFPKSFKKYKVIPPNEYLRNGDFYFTGVRWNGSSSLAVTWMNRRQNVTSVSVCKPDHPHWTCLDVQSVMSHPNRHGSWVARLPPPLLDRNGSWFLAILPIQDGIHGRFRQVCQVDSVMRKYTPLTHYPMTVLEILSWDLENHYVYFMGTVQPGTRHLFRTPDRTNEKRELDCLTCYYDNGTLTSRLNKSAVLFTQDTSQSAANTSLDESDLHPHCAYSKVYMNSLYNPRYYVLDCLGPEVPSTFLVETPGNTIAFTLNTNAVLRSLYSTMAIPQIKTFPVELESGFHAQVRLLLPPGLREYEEMTFPLVLHVDARPGGQLVSDRFHVNWLWYLAGHRNFIIAEIDGRGTGYQGEKVEQDINNKIGTVDVEDQVAVISYLRDTFRFIDKHRMGVYGEGHGGYVSSMMLTQDKDLFRCGVAVNPVTSLLLTDSYTTERYLGSPNMSDNYRAYDEADLNKRAAQLKNKQLLLVSSTADVEVSFQHSMSFVHALVRENVLFKHQVYPDVGHDLSSVAHHFYNLMDAFWDECFSPLDLQDWETMASFTPFSKE